MLQRISRIENAGPELRARRICFEDDPESRVTAAAVIKKLGIVEGVEVDRSALEQALAAEELPLAKERALQLLGYRERSAWELLKKLTDSGFPPATAKAVVDRYIEVELVDDERFASAWVRSRRSSGYGDRKILRELEQKGIDPLVAATAIGSVDPEDELERAVASLRGRMPRDRAESQRVVKRLISRGFSLSAARDAVGRAVASDSDESDGSIVGDTVDDLQ